MTQTFATDANNDLVFGGDGRLVILTGLEAVLANCEHAAKTILNEMVLAQGEGLPYFQAIWNGRPNVPVFEAAFRARISAVADVTGVQALTTRQVGDVFQYAATIRTIYGTGDING